MKTTQELYMERVVECCAPSEDDMFLMYVTDVANEVSGFKHLWAKRNRAVNGQIDQSNDKVLSEMMKRDNSLVREALEKSGLTVKQLREGFPVGCRPQLMAEVVYECYVRNAGSQLPSFVNIS